MSFILGTYSFFVMTIYNQHRESLELYRSNHRLQCTTILGIDLNGYIIMMIIGPKTSKMDSTSFFSFCSLFYMIYL